MLRLLPLSLLFACTGGDQKISTYNSDPTASITAPPTGSEVDEGELVLFSGLVADAQTDAAALTVQWSSNVDGVLQKDVAASADGETTLSTSALSVGNHEISLEVWDAEAVKATNTIALVVLDVPDAPGIEVVHPGSGETARDDEPFTMVVMVTDNQDSLESLEVSITSDVAGELCAPTPDATGKASCSIILEKGDHLLTFSVTDTTALTTSDTFLLDVQSHEAIDDDSDGWTEAQGDCDDANDAVSPRATETFNGVDDDCNGLVDDHTAGFDDDGDGQTEVDGDCDDDDNSVYAGASQTWDSKDNDCDGIVDEGTAYYDDDGDGFSDVAGDCDDANATVYPLAPEAEDALDNDCDGIVDEGTAAYDDDSDGYSENAGDCDDAAATIHPGATEILTDTVDQDCDGIAQMDNDGDGYLSAATGGDDCLDTDPYTHPGAAYNEADLSLCQTDADGDGWADHSPTSGVAPGEDCDDGEPAISPDALEVCDNADNNCDGEIDEEDADGCTEYFYDFDGDGYGSDSRAGSCLCDPNGYYTSPYDSDCYDFNSSAKPSASTYKTSNRGDGSYDWNCDGTEDKYWKTSGGCGSWPGCSTTAGWASSTPACGTSGSYVTSCSLDWLSCAETTSTYTQKCL